MFSLQNKPLLDITNVVYEFSPKPYPIIYGITFISRTITYMQVQSSTFTISLRFNHPIHSYFIK